MIHDKLLPVLAAALVALTVGQQTAWAESKSEAEPAASDPGAKECARQLATFNKCVSQMNTRLEKGACSEMSCILKWRTRSQGTELDTKVRECVETCEAKLSATCDSLEKSYDKCDENARRVAARAASKANLAMCRARWGAAMTFGDCAAKLASAPRSQEQVRAATAFGKGTFRDNGDGTVTQIDAGLVWQKADSEKKYVWEDAAGACASLALAGGGWRVPSIEEWVRLFDPTRTEHVDVAFVNTNDGYWSASPPTEQANRRDGVRFAWWVDFSPAGTYQTATIARIAVRCVR